MWSPREEAALRCCAKVEIALLLFDDLHSNIHRIIEDDLLRLFRRNAVTSHVADIRFVPIELNLGPSRVSPEVYLICRYTESRRSFHVTRGSGSHISNLLASDQARQQPAVALSGWKFRSTVLAVNCLSKVMLQITLLILAGRGEPAGHALS